MSAKELRLDCPGTTGRLYINLLFTRRISISQRSVASTLLYSPMVDARLCHESGVDASSRLGMLLLCSLIPVNLFSQVYNCLNTIVQVGDCARRF